jgi:hypothetical protein
MRRSFFTTCASSALLLAGVVACSDSTAPGAASSFEKQVSADLAPTAGAEIATDYAFFAATSSTGAGGSFSANIPAGVSASVSPGVNPSIISWINPDCARSGPHHRFVCPRFPWFGRSVDVDFTFYDATGAEQSAYDAETTDSITFSVSDTGALLFSFNQHSFADTSSHHRNVTLSNLLGDPDTLHIWNGTGSTNVHSVRTGKVNKTYQASSNDTTTDVRIRMPRNENPYPLSGTIVRNYSVTRTREGTDTTTRSTTRRVVVTFNGTALVPMLVGSETYTLNLDTRRVVKD